MKEETEKLLEVGFIRKVMYLECLANSVLIKKANCKYQVCINFTDLNQACPKDCYSLLNIYKLVDLTVGFDYLSSLDAMSEYHTMHKNDEENTSFIMEDETYWYKAIPFGLKNGGATYQRFMNKVFKDQIGRTVEVYIDDMIVKKK